MFKKYVLFSILIWQTSAAASVWLFRTHLVGAMNQRLGVAGYLGGPIKIFELPNPELHQKISAVEFLRAQNISPDDLNAWPDFILHTEPWPEEIDFLLTLKQLAPKPSKLIYLENPGSRHAELDLIVNSIHYPLLPGSNWMRPLGVASWITTQKVDQALEQWSDKLKWFKSPSIFVALGGGFDYHPYQPDYIDDLGRRLHQLAKDKHARLIITTSRRTPRFVIERLTRNLTGVVYYLYDWQTDQDNPYLAGMVLADYVIVTGDSISMMSDVMFLGKGFYIHAAPWSLTAEPPRMIEDLYIHGRARPLVGDELKKWSYPPIDVAAQIASEIKRRFCPTLLNL